MSKQRPDPPTPGTLEQQRRRLLKTGGLGVLSAGLAPMLQAASPASWTEPGSGFSNYGVPSDEQRQAIRWISANPAQPGEGVSWTPLHELEGTITPNGLHFERHHNGVPSIAAGEWSLLVNGASNRSLRFTLADLQRYPLSSKICFIECGGNSNALWQPEPVQAAAGHLHGLVSGCEWTGVPLSLLLEEAGIAAEQTWVIADGLDASGVTVSLPLSKCLDDVLLALYQNGEALRPENGYPARLLVPGWEGVVNVKWLRSLTLSATPLWSKFDTVSYTDLLANGKAERMTFQMGVKSIITTPSAGQFLDTPGVYEVRGLAWSGAGSITRVDVSADRGVTWFPADLQSPILDRALTRFRLPWQWQGDATVLMSRATDDAGNIQPTRQQLLAAKGGNAYYHYNAICAWEVDDLGAISHVYA